MLLIDSTYPTRCYVPRRRRSLQISSFPWASSHTNITWWSQRLVRRIWTILFLFVGCRSFPILCQRLKIEEVQDHRRNVSRGFCLINNWLIMTRMNSWYGDNYSSCSTRSVLYLFVSEVNQEIKFIRTEPTCQCSYQLLCSVSVSWPFLRVLQSLQIKYTLEMGSCCNFVLIPNSVWSTLPFSVPKFNRLGSPYAVNNYL